MRLFLTIIFCAIASFTFAAPQTYTVNRTDTDVGFTYFFAGNSLRGKFPDYTIDLAIDFASLKNSTVFVTLNTKTATGGFVFGTQAMRSTKVLDTQNYPDIKFKSTSITGRGDTAKIKGNVTIRGITRPLTLNAKLFRPKGSAQNDLSNLIINLTGAINRFDFGAAGFPDQVGSDIAITFNASISKQ